MEARVEAGNLHEIGPPAAELVQRGQCRGVVQRGEVCEARELVVGVRVDDQRLDELRTAVDDTVADRVGRR